MRLVGTALGLHIEQRGSDVRITAEPGRDAEAGVKVLVSLYELAERGHELTPADVEHALRIVRSEPDADLASYFEDTIVMNVDGRPVCARSPGQRTYVELLRRHEVVFGIGPAGTGKTYLAMAMAVAAIKKGQVRRLVLTRPAVEAGEKLGFLPGDLAEKVDPYLRPLYDALADMLPPDRVARMIEKRVIEVAPLAFMRGRTLNQAYVILDEAQNTTREQMKMFLTRLGEGSRMVITGDVTQIDLPRKRESGLLHALDVLAGVARIGTARLGTEDVVRHPMVAAIVDAFERAGAPEDKE